MATQQKGIMGPISGKVGDKVYSSRNGTCYVKSLPKKSTKAASPAQINQRHKLRIAARLISKIQNFLSASAKGKPLQYFGVGFAMKTILTEAISGKFPDLKIDYDRIKLSKGSLELPQLQRFELDSNRLLQIGWYAQPGVCGYISDQLVVFFCEESHGRIWVSPVKNTIRRDGELAIDFSSAKAGQVIHCWLAFKSVETRTYSQSIYAGMIVIPPKTSIHDSV